MAQVKIPFDEKEAVRYFGAKKEVLCQILGC